MENKKDQASFMPNAFCKDCGWSVIIALCNYEFCKFKDANNWDWWAYCSNKGCKNHDGEGIFQDDVEWIIQQNESK